MAVQGKTLGFLNICLVWQKRHADHLRLLALGARHKAFHCRLDTAKGKPPQGHCALASTGFVLLESSGILDEYPNLAAYVARGEARAAYRRAFEAQLAVPTG